MHQLSEPSVQFGSLTLLDNTSVNLPSPSVLLLPDDGLALLDQFLADMHAFATFD